MKFVLKTCAIWAAGLLLSSKAFSESPTWIKSSSEINMSFFNAKPRDGSDWLTVKGFGWGGGHQGLVDEALIQDLKCKHRFSKKKNVNDFDSGDIICVTKKSGKRRISIYKNHFVISCSFTRGCGLPITFVARDLLDTGTLKISEGGLSHEVRTGYGTTRGVKNIKNLWCGHGFEGDKICLHSKTNSADYDYISITRPQKSRARPKW